jgi:hypothetical protein
MKTQTLFISLLLTTLIGFTACKNEKANVDKPSAPALTVEIQSYKKQGGTDCEKPDTLRTNCATIDMKYPVVTAGEKALQDSVKAWSDTHLMSILTGGVEDEKTPSSLDAAAEVYFKYHKESEGIATGFFTAETDAEVLYNNDKYLTLAINGFTFQGGAHGSHSNSISTFDTKTGHQLTWDDLVTDKAALLKLAEKKVREERADVFQEGFEFDDIFDFKLPASYGITKEGLTLHYVQYEIMPYALGPTSLVITFEELGALSKVK